MKTITIQNYKTRFKEIKDEISFYIEKLELNFSTEEFLNFDSITYKDLDIDLNDPDKFKNQDYLILGNESYSVIEDDKTVLKRTRTTIFSMRKPKLLKLKTEKLIDIFLDYTKLISLYKEYKLLREELDLIFEKEFTDISTYQKLIPVLGIDFYLEKMREIETELEERGYNEYAFFLQEIKREEKINFEIRSVILEKKLKK